MSAKKTAKDIPVIKVPNILFNPELKPAKGEASGAACIAVWVALCLHAQWDYNNDNKPMWSDTDRDVFPSLKTLAEESHLSRKTVVLALKKLEKLGYVKKKSPLVWQGNRKNIKPL